MDTSFVKQNTVIKEIAIPLTGLAVGSLLLIEPLKTDLHNSIIDQTGILTSTVDDYFQFGPLLIDGLGHLITDSDVSSKKIYTDMALAQVLVFTTTKIMKLSFGQTRPNGGSQSFPSGHTSEAFMGAGLISYHYKDKPALIVSGYALALTTGVFRVLKNKHYLSDVIFGAAWGQLCAWFAYQFNPFIKRNDKNLNLSVGQYGLQLTYLF